MTRVTVISALLWLWILVSFLGGWSPPLWPFTAILTLVWLLALEASFYISTPFG